MKGSFIMLSVTKGSFITLNVTKGSFIASVCEHPSIQRISQARQASCRASRCSASLRSMCSMAVILRSR